MVPKKEHFLKWTRWYSALTSPNGVEYLRMKRVSREKEAQFPKHLRQVWMKGGPSALTKAIKDERGCGLGEAWSTAKRMMNE